MLKKALLLIAVVCMLTPLCAAETLVRVGGGVLVLLEPDLSGLEDIPTIDITEGGGAFNIQALPGPVGCAENLRWGISANFLRVYRYEYHTSVPNEFTFNAFPVLFLLEYDFARDAVLKPFVQAGVGASFDMVITENPDTSTERSTDFALMAGPGLSLRFSERLSLDLLAQYFLLFTGTEYTHIVYPSLNLGLRF